MSQPQLDEAKRLRALGAAATAGGRAAAGAKTLRAALAIATGLAPDLRDGAVEGRILISLAYAEAEQGDVRKGLSLLDEAARRGGTPALVHGQRGLLLARTGRISDALGELDRAVTTLREDGDRSELARALLNRAYVRLEFGLAGGQLGQIHTDLTTCLRIGRDHGLTSLAIKAVQSLGHLDFLSGNLPAALRRLDQAARQCAVELPSYLPAIVLDKAKVLLAAGLPDIAARELGPAIDTLRRYRMSEDLAEAELVRAKAELLAGRADTAGDWANAARRRFRRRDNNSWAALAASISLRADFARDVEPASLARRGAWLSRRLAALELADEASSVALLTARAHLRAGQVTRARQTCTAVPAPESANSLDRQLLWHLTHAELARAQGDSTAQFEHLRTGLARLHRHRTLLGSVDLQTGITLHGRELAAAGLASALAGGRPEEVFEWTELARAQAFRTTPARPPRDVDSAHLLGQLRYLMSTLRRAERRGEPSDQLRHRRAELERMVRERAWLRGGSGTSTPVVTMRTILGHLDETAMIIYARSADGLAALVLTGGGAKLMPIGSYGAARESLRRLHADLNTLAGRNVPGRMRDSLEGSARRDGRKVADALVTPLLAELGDRPVVVVPTGELYAVPWLQLPGMLGRPVVVTPSATVWSSARQRGESGHKPGRPVLVAGPGLAHAETEIRDIGEHMRGPVRLTGAGATPAATLAALDGAPVAHLAAHGHHEPGNALFSSLDLSGGALMGYDLQDLHRPPQHVVLSACDVGMTSVRTGDETIGMVTALLHAGSATVIASVCRIADTWPADVMIPYHRAVMAGSPPAHALTTAVSRSPHAAFVCFGST